MRAADAAVLALEAAGVEIAAGVPGESFLGLLDALYGHSSLRFLATRHESGAAFLVEAYGALTGRVGLVVATRMVGAANLSIGVHAAQQAHTPMLIVLGQVSTPSRHRGAFQEAELADIFSRIAKCAIEVPDATRLPDLLYSSAILAATPPTGPVVVAVREDHFEATIPMSRLAPRRWIPGAPTLKTIAYALSQLRAARQPAILVGAGLRVAGAMDWAVRLSRSEAIPVFTAWRQADAYPNDEPGYAGQVGLGASADVWQYLEAADVVLVVGASLDEQTTRGFTIPGPDCLIIQVDQEPRVSNHSGPYTYVQSGCLEFLRELSHRSDVKPRVGSAARSFAAGHGAMAGSAAALVAHTSMGVPKVVEAVCESLVDGAILTSDAGEFAGELTRTLRLPPRGRFLAPISGAMGYGIPSAIGARLAQPNAPVTAVVGDGGFAMTGSELETAVRERLPISVVVVDNRSYGAIARHQERVYPGRALGTQLGQIDVVSFARSMGAEAHAILSLDALRDALSESPASLPRVLWVPVENASHDTGSNVA